MPHPIPPPPKMKALVEMISLIEEGVISGKIAKDALPRLLAGEGNGGVRAFVESQGMVQISGEPALADPLSSLIKPET
jgi:aspartyl-tRNA(Asn)/glutamyl-tRNA(Gln) amidotransferase subunit B